MPSSSPASTQQNSIGRISSPILRLSQEVVDEIIDSIAMIDPWIVREEERRFGSFFWAEETVPKCLQRVKELYMIMKCNPQIVAYVRELTLKAVPYDTAWITEDPYLRRILALLERPGNSLKKLSILGLHDCILETRKPDNLFRITNTISSLHLGFMQNIPLAMIEGCVQLTDLSLNCVEIDSKPCRAGTSRQVRPALQKLKFFNSSNAMKLLLGRYRRQTPSHIDFSTIRVFSVNPASQEELLLAGEVIKIASGSLEEFTLDGQYRTKTMIRKLLHPWVFRNFAHLENSTSLRSLDVELSFQGFDYAKEDPVDAISDVLSTLPKPNQLRRLRIKMFIGQNNAVDPHEFHKLAWARLASELNRIKSGNSLDFFLELHYRPSTNSLTEEEMYIDRGYEAFKRVLTPACKAIFQHPIHQQFKAATTNSDADAASVILHLEIHPDFPKNPRQSISDLFSAETRSLIR
ncbi:hypothetical protein M413DRAFT_415935 [Hebeloma cylindrosporum]|uniref:F-box domain-containing protein n=1 Tax=Hebeloma cylindrosporum TaxID=76867 RepID=A0A0C3C6T9_HEBCY|nr:hypothetical protein M413DRAFT_415935 [Hebeloma cylindrosporum h7]